MSVGDFFLPGVGSGLTYPVYWGINVVAMIFGVAFPAWLFAMLRKRRRKDGKLPKKELFIALAVSAGITIFLMWLCYCAVNSLQGSIYDLAQRLVQVFDPVFGVSRLVSDPINGFFGINLSLRIAAACLMVLSVMAAWKGAGWSADQFAQYLDQKFLSKKSGDDEKDPPENDGESPQAGEESLKDDEDGEDFPKERKEPSQGDGTSRWDALLSKLFAFLASGSGIGLLAYILGPEEAQNGIKDVLEAVGGFLEKVTLMSQIDPGATGLTAFFSKSLFVILSIFMLGIYVAAILLLVAFIQAIIKNWPKIIGWIERKKKIIWTCLGIVLLSAAACAALVAMSYVIKNGGPFIGTFQGGALGVFVSNFAVLSISVCAALLMLIFVLSFVILAGTYAVQVVRALIQQWGEKEWSAPTGTPNAGRTAGMLLGVFVWTALLIAAGWGYPRIQEWLEKLFSNEDPLQLLERLGFLTLMMAGALAIAAAGLLLALLMLQGMVALFEEKGDPIVNRIALLLKSLLLRTVEFFSLLPFFVEHACKALRSVLYTILQIFIGYRNESEKNSAFFTAACFASLASLLNTFFGLKGFYDASGHWELMLCSAAIACAVQLAMLISGMKAGEGMAEKKFMFGLRRKNDEANFEPMREISGERLSRPKPRRLPYSWYLRVYLLLMVVSTGFAFNNMFGYYASTAQVHERVYDQVRYKTDEELQLSQTIGMLISEYNTNTGEIFRLFSERSDETSAVRMAIETEYRTAANSDDGDQVDANNRDRFIGKTRDLEIQIAAIKSLIGADYDVIGKNVKIYVEEYDHYWGGNPQPSYRTACLVIYYEDESNDEKKTTVGSYLNQDTPTVTGLKVKDGDGNDMQITFKIPRYIDPDSDSQTIIKLPRKVVVDKDKYGILRELIGQYEQLERRIYDDDQFSEIGGGHTRPAQSIGIQLNDLLTRNSELDGIRANIVELCRTDDSSSTSFDGGDASMQALRQLTNNYLNQDILRQSGGESAPDAASQEEARKQSFKELSAYIDRALALYNVLAGYTNDTGTDAEGSQDMNISKVSVKLLGEDESKSSSEAPPADNDSEGLTVRTFRNYAQGLTYSNFQISYDALTGGRLGLNPVKDNIDTLYSSTIVAWFILIICLIVDMMAFFAGLLIFKDIYLFRKNNMIEEIGYLNYETALSSLFAIPKESRERVLCLAAVYRLLYGDTSEDGETLDTDTNSAEDSGTPEEDTGNAGDGETPEENTDSARDGGTPDEDTGNAGDGETPEENTDSARDGGTSDEDTHTAEDGGAPDEDINTARDGETLEENTDSARDGGTSEEDINTARDGETLEENTDSARDGGTSEEDTNTAEDGGTPDEDSCVVGNNDEAPRENDSAVEEVGRTPGEAERELPSQALAEVSMETDSQVVLAKRMREILGSEDFKKFYRKVELVLRALGISEDEETSYGMFLLWLRSYAERTNLNFDDVFLSDDK